MTRGKASTSAWNRPGSSQRPIGTTKDLRREGGPRDRERSDNCGHLLPLLQSCRAARSPTMPIPATGTTLPGFEPGVSTSWTCPLADRAWMTAGSSAADGGE
jgi:hypothetical protein